MPISASTPGAGNGQLLANLASFMGEGGEQNAPLGRAVIGGLALATVATLFFVPVVFSLLHRPATVSKTAGADAGQPPDEIISAPTREESL